MKKILIVLILSISVMTEAQENKQVPQINVSGEGRIKVVPDKACIIFGVENLGKDAQDVKKQNDETVDKVVKFIKSFGIPISDFQTTNVSLNRNYDYDKKKYSFQASQTITIFLTDLKKYDALMMGLVDNGINNISNVSFESSKIEDYKSDARKMAMKDAKKKADDYVSVLNQKVGKALLISDSNTQNYYPQPMYKAAMAMSDSAMPQRETLAIGEIEVTANVTVSFMLE